jgi:hypothetical protein
MLLLIESLLVVAAIVLAFCCPRLGESWFAPLERGLSRLARRRLLSVVIVGLTALILRVMLLPILPIPEPAVHDEFSYLLAADTFAHGRLANPTHPMWVHFETFHVNQKPTYVSMYYPAQGLFMAAGQVIFGHPFWGVWLSTGLMCAAICWMLQGWLPPFWALLGGLLAVIRLGTFSYWMNSYWGGSVAALGGALVLGALPRIKRQPRVRDAALMGVGFALLANSRPYEGLIFTIAVLAAFALWKRRAAVRVRRWLPSRTVGALAVMFVITLGAMGYYFWRTTGSPFQTPYVVNTSAYRPVPLFPWQSMSHIPMYQHAAMRSYYLGWAVNQYNLARYHEVITLLFKAFKFWFFFLGPVLTLPLFAASFVLPFGISFRDLSHRSQALLLICGLLFVAAALPVCFEPHYIAPATCVFYSLILIAMRRVRHWSPGNRPVGVALDRAVPTIAVVLLILRLFTPTDSTAKLATWYAPVVVNTYRAQLLSQLERMPGLHLVIIRYNSKHIPADEWVFNGADIDYSKVVWARDMGAEGNAELIRYFKSRKVWLVEPDKIPPQLSPSGTNVEQAKLQ